VRQLRTFAAVAERHSFTRAADDLHIAQQAVSQQIRALEQSLGVTLLERSSRRVTLTPEGSVFLADCSRVLSAADRASKRVRAAARGEVGSLRLAFTLTTVWDTIPVLLARLGTLCPQLKVEAREVFGGDIEELLTSGRYDLALAPLTSYAHSLQHRTIRRERLRVALGDRHTMADSDAIELSALGDEQFEIWPREMAPGFYDAVVGVCRAAGFEPSLDERAAGNTVWGNIARGRGVALINGSLIEQLPRGIKLVNVADPQPKLTIDAVWHGREILPIVQRALEAAALLASERHWLTSV
jgi:DNA-binding transcriptional LysR family regulator